MVLPFQAMFYQGEARMIDHTPGSALVCGEIVDLGNYAGVVVTPEGIASGALGAVEVDAIYKVKKAVGTGVTFSAGADVFWDDTNNTAVTAGGAGIFRLGMATEAAVTGDDHVKCWINHDGIQS